jgi:hypothetical protein
MWEVLLELARWHSGAWTLIGGQMVFLHALERGVTPPRLSQDLDLLINARIVAHGVSRVVAAIEARGFVLEGASPDGIAHRYRHGQVSVDVLAPDGLGSRADLTTTPPGRTVQVPGGSQALTRTALLPVVTRLSSGHIPRPSLLGAIICKAAAVAVDDVPNDQRSDLAFLLSLVDDPIDLATETTAKDRRRLRSNRELEDPSHPAWVALPVSVRDRGRAAFAFLSRRSR